MSDDEPQAPAPAPAPEVDHTVLIPTPGGRRADDDAPPVQPEPTRLVAPSSMAASSDPVASFGRNAGLNPLLDPAAPVLDLLVELRATLAHDEPEALRERIAEQVRRFESGARAHGLAPETVFTARYVLCTAIDEAVLSHAWGQQSVWATRNLLTTFHNEVSGGETFFRLLETLSEDPAGNIDMLELMYVLLALGFEGRYRLRGDGRDALELTRDRLFRIIRAQRGDSERQLSPHWRGVEVVRNTLVDYVPLWVVGALGALLLLGTYFGFSLRLAGAADPVAARLYTLGRDALVIERAAPVVKPPKPLLDLPTLLAEEIARGEVAVHNRRDGQAVVFRGDNLFASGRASVNRKYRELLARIAVAIKDVEGKALVTGHSDNIPIRTVRFPSNLALSQARADGVRALMIEGVGGEDKVQAEGRADSEPVVANDSRENRARNRRVEILVSYPGYSAPPPVPAPAGSEA